MNQLRNLLNTQIDEPKTHLALLFLRITAGGMMLTHGWPKLLKLLDGNFKFADPIGLGPEVSLVLAVLAEFFASVFVILGLFTRFGAFLLSFTMFVAAFVQHENDPFQKKEMALLYMIIFLFILVTGSGKYAIDRKLD